MPNIKPISDLRNYAEVLRDVSMGEPVFLTKNGRGRFAILTIDDYEKTRQKLKLLEALAEGEQAAAKGELYTLDEVKSYFSDRAKDYEK